MKLHNLNKKFIKNIFQKIKISLFFILFLNFISNKSTMFLSRYIVPELNPIPFLTYRRLYQSIGFQPFIIGGNNAHIKSCFGRGNGYLGTYETGGILSLRALNDAINIVNPESTNVYPSEWIAAGLYSPMRLYGQISGSGLAWNFSYELIENLLIGWTSGFCLMSGILNLEPQKENDVYVLRESLTYSIYQCYKKECDSLKLNNTYSHITSFADQDIYLRLEHATDFCLRMRRIKFAGQIGCVLPTSPSYEIYNPSTFVIGLNGHYAYYAGLQLDLLMKEDLTFGLIGKGIIQTSKNQTIRVPVSNEPVAYGAYVNSFSVSPGPTVMFSTYLSLEGLRRGLGLKLAYTVFDHFTDSFCLNNEINSSSIDDNKLDLIKKYSSWAQEHFTVAAFYDFMREKEFHDMEPFLGLSVQIPVDFFFSKQSVRSYSLSFILEVLY